MKQRIKEAGVLLVTLALLAVLALRADGFFTWANFTDLFLSTMPVMIVAIGMSLIILTGHIDISVGSIFAVSSIVMGACSAKGIPALMSGLIACLLGALFGAINGALVSYLRIPSIVVTLATMVILRDGLRWVTQGSWIVNLPEHFQWFGLNVMTYTVACFACVVILILAAALGLQYTRYGRVVFATGSNVVAARIVGINTNRVVFSVFTLTGALTGLSSVLNAVRFNQIPSNLGLGLEMKVIAAIAIGGAAITGGSTSIMGTVLGVILLGCISSSLTFLHIDAYWEKAIQGCIILIAIASDTLASYRRQDAKLLAS